MRERNPLGSTSPHRSSFAERAARGARTARGPTKKELVHGCAFRTRTERATRSADPRLHRAPTTRGAGTPPHEANPQCLRAGTRRTEHCQRAESLPRAQPRDSQGAPVSNSTSGRNAKGVPSILELPPRERPACRTTRVQLQGLVRRTWRLDVGCARSDRVPLRAPRADQPSEQLNRSAQWPWLPS